VWLFGLLRDALYPSTDHHEQGLEVVSVGAGASLLLLLSLPPGVSPPLAPGLLAAATLGFLMWNWHYIKPSPVLSHVIPTRNVLGVSIWGTAFNSILFGFRVLK